MKKPILIIDSQPREGCIHFMVRIDSKPQIKFLSDFFSLFLSKNVLTNLKQDLTDILKFESFSSIGIVDKDYKLDFLFIDEGERTFIFVVINAKEPLLKKIHKIDFEEFFVF